MKIVSTPKSNALLVLRRRLVALHRHARVALDRPLPEERLPAVRLDPDDAAEPPLLVEQLVDDDAARPPPRLDVEQAPHVPVGLPADADRRHELDGDEARPVVLRLLPDAEVDADGDRVLPRVLGRHLEVADLARAALAELDVLELAAALLVAPRQHQEEARVVAEAPGRRVLGPLAVELGATPALGPERDPLVDVEVPRLLPALRPRERRAVLLRVVRREPDALAHRARGRAPDPVGDADVGRVPVRVRDLDAALGVHRQRREARPLEPVGRVVGVPRRVLEDELRVLDVGAREHRRPEPGVHRVALLLRARVLAVEQVVDEEPREARAGQLAAVADRDHRRVADARRPVDRERRLRPRVVLALRLPEPREDEPDLGRRQADVEVEVLPDHRERLLRLRDARRDDDPALGRVDAEVPHPVGGRARRLREARREPDDAPVVRLLEVEEHPLVRRRDDAVARRLLAHHEREELRRVAPAAGDPREQGVPDQAHPLGLPAGRCCRHPAEGNTRGRPGLRGATTASGDASRPRRSFR
jgi:hypothetical protein